MSPYMGIGGALAVNAGGVIGFSVLDHALSLGQSALVTAWIVLFPLIAVTLIVGLLVGIFQATTQIQEQTLSFAPKLLVLTLILFLAGPWFLRIMTQFASSDLANFWKYLGIP